MKRKYLISLALLSCIGLSGCATPGPVGPQGPAGDQGIQGPAGPVGPQGPAGENGQDGKPGADGEDGKPGANGQDGDVGPEGPQGPIGPEGPAGPEGPVGPVGPQGPAGENGQDGKPGADGHDGKPGENGQDGKPGADGHDGKPGADGDTPYIGDNGNWWIGDKDTGVLADSDKANDPNISDGFTFELGTIKHKAGAILGNYNGTDKDVIMPNYIGNVPVIGIRDNVFSDINSLKLSKNIISLGTISSSTITSIDFNGCKLEEFVPGQFENCSNLKSIDIPDTLKKIGDNAFYNTSIENIDFKNVEELGSQIFTSYGDLDKNSYIYVPKTVKKINNTFNGYRPVYFEVSEKPLEYNIYDSAFFAFGCKQDNDYIYSTLNNEVTVHQYIGQGRDIVIPSEINGMPVKAIGNAGFKGNYNYTSNLKNEKEFIYDSVIIPNTVEKIGLGAFSNLYAGYIYYPKSIVDMGGKSFETGCKLTKSIYEDSEYNINQKFPNYLTDSSHICDVPLDSIEVNDKSEILILNNSKTAYSFAGFKTKSKVNDTISASYKNKPITTIKSYALKFNPGIFSINYFKIPNSITKIETNAIFIPYGIVSISNSVERVQKSAVYCDKVFVSMPVIPADWDSQWLDHGQLYLGENINVSQDFIYEVVGNEVHLKEYIGAEQTHNSSQRAKIRIPRTIDGKVVTTLKRGSISTDYYLNYFDIYIPKNITTIQDYAISGYYAGGDRATIYIEKGSTLSTAYGYMFQDQYGYSTYDYIYRDQVFDY